MIHDIWILNINLYILINPQYFVYYEAQHKTNGNPKPHDAPSCISRAKPEN